MKYIALLRGINVGGNRKVEMKKLRTLFESFGYTEVSTYINSGNIIFESEDDQKTVLAKITKSFEKTFDFEIPTLVKTEKEMKKLPKRSQRNGKMMTHKGRMLRIYFLRQIPKKSSRNYLSKWIISIFFI